jgi:hypothetical protein
MSRALACFTPNARFVGTPVRVYSSLDLRSTEVLPSERMEFVAPYRGALFGSRRTP